MALRHLEQARGLMIRDMHLEIQSSAVILNAALTNKRGWMALAEDVVSMQMRRRREFWFVCLKWKDLV
jgi:hypothetical protein